MIKTLKVETSFQMMKTPMPYILPGKYRKLVKDARREFKQLLHREYFINEGSSKFYVYQFNSSAKKKALVVHGWMSESPHMLMFVKYLISQDYQVFCLDLPGHGRSPKSFLTWQKAVNAILSTDHSFGPFDLTLGHSFGGGMLMNSTAASMLSSEFDNRLYAKKHIFLASALSINVPVGIYTKFMRLNSNEVEKLKDRISTDAKIPIENMSSSYFVQNFPQNSKYLLLHGTKDFVVNIDESRKLDQASEKVTLQEIEGMGHFKIIFDPKVLEYLDSFV